MYLISYQKSNGEIFCRIRDTIPACGICGETSMGWKVLDVKCRYKNSYYSFSEYNKLECKYKKKKHILKRIKKFATSYSTILTLIVLFFLIK